MIRDHRNDRYRAQPIDSWIVAADDFSVLPNGPSRVYDHMMTNVATPLSHQIRLFTANSNFASGEICPIAKKVVSANLNSSNSRRVA